MAATDEELQLGLAGAKVVQSQLNLASSLLRLAKDRIDIRNQGSQPEWHDKQFTAGH